MNAHSIKNLYSLSANMGDKMKHRKAIWSWRPQFDKCFVPWRCHPAPHLFTSLQPLLEPYSCSQGHVVSQVREPTQVNKKIAWWGKKGYTGFQSSSPHKERYQHNRGRRGWKDSRELGLLEQVLWLRCSPAKLRRMQRWWEREYKCVMIQNKSES